MSLKVMVVFGTRPEAIKMAPVVKALTSQSDKFEAITCLTAQHREMLDQVMDIFELRSNIDLDIMTHGQDLFEVTSKVVLGMRDALTEHKPDIILVHGDTTTSTFAALAGFYNQIPVAHVEAGLRSHLRYSPFPEEMNRLVTGRLANFHFAPTIGSKANLLAEGIPEDKIFVTGNTAIDALLSMVDTPLTAEIEETFTPGKRGILVTAHRRENFGEGITNICNSLIEVSEKFSDVEIIYPVHRNPNILEPVSRLLADRPGIRLLEPVDYCHFVRLMHDAHLILTDSGGVQEEAPSLGVPVLVLRECTERPEAVTAGTVKLVGTEQETIVKAASDLLDNQSNWESMAHSVNPYGDGKAAQRIVSHIHNLLAANDQTKVEIDDFIVS